MKRHLRVLYFILSMVTVFSIAGISTTALAISNFSQAKLEGNVPATFTPNSEITFNAEGNYEITNIYEGEPSLQSMGPEIGGNLADEDPEAFEAANQAIIAELESLPVYTYEEYYIAREGAVAIYDQNGELIRVRGDYDYYSTLDQYLINGSLPDGKYVGTYSTFTQVSFSENVTRAGASSTLHYGKFTTYGDNWPEIDPKKYPNSNAEPFKYIDGVKYGDRIGSNNNVLKIGDVAVRPEDNAPYDSSITVTVQASDTNGKGVVSKPMRVRDNLPPGAAACLDIFRWDNPEWFTGEAQSPDNVYFGHTYNKYLSFTNEKNYWKLDE